MGGQQLQYYIGMNTYRVVANNSIMSGPFFVFFLLNVLVTSYGHVGMVSSPNHTFFLGKLEEVVNQYFVHILWLVTFIRPDLGPNCLRKLSANDTCRQRVNR